MSPFPDHYNPTPTSVPPRVSPRLPRPFQLYRMLRTHRILSLLTYVRGCKEVKVVSDRNCVLQEVE
jgi:hypothetical protein